MVFYWKQKEFFENGAAAFQRKGRTGHSADQERIACPEKKIRTKDEILAELMAEHVALLPGTGWRRRKKIAPEGLDRRPAGVY